MKRIKKTRPLDVILVTLGAILLPLMFATGNLLIGIAALILIVVGFATRKPESYDEYRDRYDLKYGGAGVEESDGNGSDAAESDQKGGAGQ